MDEEREAAREARRDDPGAQTRAWLLETKSATLCTTCAREGLEGYPHGSVVPFAVCSDGRPVIYIASIAAHTKNLVADARATLFVRQPGLDEDPQVGWRVGLMGRWARLISPARTPKTTTGRDKLVDEDELLEVQARYRERVPGAWDYAETHDFWYWRLEEVERVRYIAGFGKIAWLDGDEVLRAGKLDDEAAVAHMNADHADNMVEMCQGLAGFRPARAECVSIDRTGMLVRTPERPVFFSFGREISGDEVRGAVVEVLQRARA